MSDMDIAADVFFEVADLDQRGQQQQIVATLFFAKKLVLYYSLDASARGLEWLANPNSVGHVVLDDTIGPLFGVGVCVCVLSVHLQKSIFYSVR